MVYSGLPKSGEEETRSNGRWKEVHREEREIESRVERKGKETREGRMRERTGNVKRRVSGKGEEKM